MADTWELPLLWISCSVSCFPSWAAPRAASSALLQEMCQARRGSGCVGKISVIMSIQVCLGFFNLIEKSQRHYSSTLGGAGPCYIFHGLVQSSSAVPWHSVVVPAMGPPGTKLLPALSLCAPHCPCSPSRGVGGGRSLCGGIHLHDLPVHPLVAREASRKQDPPSSQHQEPRCLPFQSLPCPPISLPVRGTA